MRALVITDIHVQLFFGPERKGGQKTLIVVQQKANCADAVSNKTHINESFVNVRVRKRLDETSRPAEKMEQSYNWNECLDQHRVTKLLFRNYVNENIIVYCGLATNLAPLA